jgi:hypothetical protein
MKHHKPPESSGIFSVSLQSVRKSGRVLYALSQFYLPFYNCDLRTLLFDHYDVFGCVSAAIYEIDEIIEAGTSPEEAFRKLDQLLKYLGSKIECDQYILDRFEDARRYYQFEANLLRGRAVFSLADLTALTEIRSFDFRLMHRALIQLISLQYDQQVFSWFRWFEILMEVEDDLLSAQDDMDRGTYNVFCLTKRNSPEAASSFVEDYRCQIEQNLISCATMFPEHQKLACDAVFSTYRQIVPRSIVSVEKGESAVMW